MNFVMAILTAEIFIKIMKIGLIFLLNLAVTRSTGNNGGLFFRGDMSV